MLTTALGLTSRTSSGRGVATIARRRRLALPLDAPPGDVHGVDAWTRAPLLVETRWECAER